MVINACDDTVWYALALSSSDFLPRVHGKEPSKTSKFDVRGKVILQKKKVLDFLLLRHLTLWLAEIRFEESGNRMDTRTNEEQNELLSG